MGPGDTLEEEHTPLQLPLEDLARAVKEIPEIQALINTLKVSQAPDNNTPRRPYSQPHNNYSQQQPINNYSQQHNFQVSPNYRGNYPRPQHEVYQRHNHQRGYSPQSQAYSSGGVRPSSPSNNWQPTPHHPRQNTLRQVDLMITYVVDATTFWAQVVQGDIVNMSLKLEENLKKECPTLPPVQKVGKGHVYGTLFDGGWYRCISCGPPDPDDIVDILFVDYGNKERKHLNELVWLSAPAFTSVPFLATPFILPGLSPVPEYADQAISLFSTNETLQGYITCVPKVEEFCSIKLLRPPGDDNEPQLRDYNSLLLHKGYVTSSTVHPAPPPTYHYISGLQQRLQYMSQLLREKEHTITNLNKDLLSIQDLPAAQPHLLQDPVQHLEDIETEIVPEIPELVLESMPRAPRTVSEISAPEHITEQEDEEVEILDEALLTDHVTNGQDLFIRLFSEADHYKELLSNNEVESELVKLLKYRRVLSDNTLPEEVTQSRGAVSEGEKRLACAQEEIRNCQKKNLQLLTELRDADVTSLTSAIHTYTAAVAACNGQQLLSNVENVMLDLGDCAMTEGEFKTVAEAFEALSKVCSKYTEQKNLCKKEISELLKSLCNNWEIELGMLQRVNSIVGLEEDDYTAPDASAVVFDTYLLAEKLLDSFQHFQTIISDEINEKTPLSFSIKSLLLIQAKSQYKQLKPAFGCVSDLEQRAVDLSSFITDKPDITILTTLKKDIKAARRIVKLAQIEASSDDEDDDKSDTLHTAMIKLHDLYLEEEANLIKISSQAQGPYPELLINNPQLKNIISGEDIVKAGWELSHFVMPNNYMSINSLKQRVLDGIYRDEVAYFVEYSLQQNTEESLEEEAIRLIKDNLDGCFAIFIDSKCSRAYGCTKIPPE